MRQRREKRRSALAISQCFYMSFAVACITLTIVLPLTISNRADFEVLASQRQSILLGPDGVLNAGDSIVYNITITNVGKFDLTNVTVTNNVGATLICQPGGVNNVIGLLPMGVSYECSSVYMLTQTDIEAGMFLFQTFVNAMSIPETVVENVADLTQASFASLALFQSYELDLGTNDFLTVGDVITITTKLHNNGTETLTNVTSSNYNGTALTLNPTGCFQYMYQYAVTQQDLDNEFRMFNDTASGISAVTQNEIEAFASIEANLTRPVVALLELEFRNIQYGDTCAASGGVVTYEVEVTNIATNATVGITVTDTLSPLICDPGGVDNTIASLLSGESQTCFGVYMLQNSDVQIGFPTNLDFEATATYDVAQTANATSSTQIQAPFIISWPVGAVDTSGVTYPIDMRGFSTFDFRFDATFQGPDIRTVGSCYGNRELSILRFTLGQRIVFNNFVRHPRHDRFSIQLADQAFNTQFRLDTVPSSLRQNIMVVVNSPPFMSYDPMTGLIESNQPAGTNGGSLTFTISNTTALTSLTFEALSWDMDDFVGLIVDEILWELS